MIIDRVVGVEWALQKSLFSRIEKTQRVMKHGNEQRKRNNDTQDKVESAVIFAS